MVTSDDSAAVTPKDRDEMQVDDHTTASLAVESVDDHGRDARTTDEIEDDAAPSIETDAATKHTDNVDAAAVNGNHADAPAQEEEASPSSSIIPGQTYERLEFLGSRAISAAVARHLYGAHPGLRPGPLTRLHDVNVGTEKLARAAVARGLHRFLRHEMPFFALRVGEFAEEAAAYPVDSNGQVTAPKHLADLVESLMGAVFLDSGSDHERLWQAFLRLADPLIGPKMLPRLKNPMSELSELCQGMGLSAPIEKKDWAWSHTVSVVIEGETVGSGTNSKNHVVARNRAAMAALNTIKARKAWSTEALLKGEDAAAGSSPLLQDEEAIAGLQVPPTPGKRHGCCCGDASASNKRFKLAGTVPSEAMAESEHSKIHSEASHP